MKEVGKSLNCVKMKNCEQICSVFLSQCRSIRQNLLYLSPSWHLRAYLTNCYQFIWISKLYSTYLYALYLSCTYKRKLNFLIIQQTWYWTLIAQFCICNNFISAFIHFLFSVFFFWFANSDLPFIDSCVSLSTNWLKILRSVEERWSDFNLDSVYFKSLRITRRYTSTRGGTILLKANESKTAHNRCALGRSPYFVKPRCKLIQML